MSVHPTTSWTPQNVPWKSAYLCGAGLGTRTRPVRKTERFKALVRKAGLVDYWRARGWPDLCRPMGADDFVCD